MAENKIELQLPIKIRETIKKDGYVISDSQETEHFFYRKETEKGDEEQQMVYDGFCVLVDKSKKTKDLGFWEINGEKVKIPKSSKAREILFDGKEMFDEKWVEEKDKEILNTIKGKFPNGCGLKLNYVAKHKDAEGDLIRIISCYGGKNGHGVWTDYLEQWKNVFQSLSESFGQVWLIELKNDCVDDVFDLYIGVI